MEEAITGPQGLKDVAYAVVAGPAPSLLASMATGSMAYSPLDLRIEDANGQRIPLTIMPAEVIFEKFGFLITGHISEENSDEDLSWIAEEHGLHPVGLHEEQQGRTFYMFLDTGNMTGELIVAPLA